LLPRRKRRRGHRPGRSPASLSKQRRSITERRAEVEGRGRPGHWEADFMLFARCGQALLALHERQSRFNMARPPLHRRAVRTRWTSNVTPPPACARYGDRLVHLRDTAHGAVETALFCPPCFASYSAMSARWSTSGTGSSLWCSVAKPIEMVTSMRLVPLLTAN